VRTECTGNNNSFRTDHPNKRVRVKEIDFYFGSLCCTSSFHSNSPSAVGCLVDYNSRSRSTDVLLAWATKYSMSQKRTSRSDRVLHEELEDSKPPAVTRTYTVTPDMKSPPAANSSSQKDIERQLPPRTGRKRTTESPATRTTRASATRLALEEEDHDDDDRPLQPERKNTTRISPDSETPYSGLRSRRSFSSSDTSFGSVPVPPSLSYQQTEPISNTTNALAAGAAAGGGSKGKTSPPVPPPLPVERPSIADTMEDSLLPRTDSTIDDTTLSSRSNSSVTNSTMNTLDLVLAQRYAGYYEHLPTTEDQVVVEEDGDNLTTESLHSSVTQSTQNTLDLVLTKRYAAFYGEQNGTKEDQRKTRKPTMAPQAPLENGKARGDRGEDTATQLLLDEKRRQAGGYISRDLDQYKSAERPSQDCSGWVNVNAHHNTVRMDDDDGFNDETSHDESLSTTPDPPSLRVRDHYVRPGAYRMRQGGVARHVDNDSVVSSSLRTISTLRTNLGLGIIEASLVPDDIVPKGEPDTDSKKDSNSNQQYIATNDGTYNDDDGDDDCECPSAPAPPTYATSGGGQTFLTSSTASPVVQAQPLDDGHTIRAFFNKKSIRCLILLFTVIFVLLALGAVYAVTGFVFDDMRKSQGGQNDAYSPDGDGVTASSAPTTSPTSQGDLDLEYFVRAILPEYTKESLTRSNSPQTKALQWLQNNTHLESYPISRRLQRFALASLYFSTGGKKRWTKDFGWLSDEDECTWFSTERDLAVCRESEYKVLSLQANGLQGTIVPEISLLSSLEFVRMGKNILTGFLPTTLGSLSGLRELRLCKSFSCVSCLPCFS